ncbi:MAG: hypothetical protein KatS3mg109_1503 [Pirellulaceae bacterium]|nr:MAG: hypothetical protein KatS3mg109_1503 [Pirellulaceae bacterium]GIW95448.1 MAG: hypothetical protein KatS3mg110_3489 [Pirellulaceae bacterium]GIW96633.1 MAG: hypothetical protein KatS3mg110_4674 [Pirellulaceae bacterium]
MGGRRVRCVGRWLLGGWLLAAGLGCRVCPVPADYSYNYYGGAVARANPYEGRVGSAFDDGSWLSEEAVLDSDLPPEDAYFEASYPPVDSVDVAVAP